MRWSPACFDRWADSRSVLPNKSWSISTNHDISKKQLKTLLFLNLPKKPWRRKKHRQEFKVYETVKFPRYLKISDIWRIWDSFGLLDELGWRLIWRLWKKYVLHHRYAELSNALYRKESLESFGVMVRSRRELGPHFYFGVVKSVWWSLKIQRMGRFRKSIWWGSALQKVTANSEAELWLWGNWLTVQEVLSRAGERNSETVENEAISPVCRSLWRYRLSQKKRVHMCVCKLLLGH